MAYFINLKGTPEELMKTAGEHTLVHGMDPRLSLLMDGPFIARIEPEEGFLNQPLWKCSPQISAALEKECHWVHIPELDYAPAATWSEAMHEKGYTYDEHAHTWVRGMNPLFEKVPGEPNLWRAILSNTSGGMTTQVIITVQYMGSHAFGISIWVDSKPQRRIVKICPSVAAAMKFAIQETDDVLENEYKNIDAIRTALRNR